MSGYHLCQVKKARHPYYIESISTNIFTIEELCFYLQKNIYLIDETIINEKLLDWIRDELGLVRLYRKLYEQLEKGEGIGSFILPIFKEIGYLSHEEFKELQDKIREIEIQPDDLRRKLKADYLVEYKMYNNALHEYYQILKDKGPGKMGESFYAAVWSNMAAAYSRLFLFEEAADCLWKSYETVRSSETYRRYLITLPLFMSRADYEKKLLELKIPKVQREKVEAAAKEARNVEDIAERQEEEAWTEIRSFLEEEKQAYHKSTCVS
ncbi:MAG TPA: hypothetical protein IAB26_15555 [Candidatus Limivivens merdigallinarum]|uniref:Uncharacterized protein n=1 Tax=Candidatus Limivivens merdigallinarum TaxID=2840859 RepID=A0A9D1A011_9FIRM|nr:hypothetical protein [Candidatus Limivivens merdigallinarum]